MHKNLHTILNCTKTTRMEENVSSIPQCLGDVHHPSPPEKSSFLLPFLITISLDDYKLKELNLWSSFKNIYRIYNANC